MANSISHSTTTHQPSIVRNAVARWVGLAINTIITFLLTPFVIREIGQTDYGFWIIVGSLIGYYGLLNLGVSSAISRYVAKAIGEDRIEDMNLTVNTSMAMFLCTGVLVSVGSFLVTTPVSRFFGVQAEYVEQFRILIIVMGVTTAINFVNSVLVAIATAHEQIVLTSMIRLVSQLFRTFFVVVFVRGDMGVIGLGLGTLIGSVVQLSMSFIVVKKRFPWVRFELRAARWNHLKELITFGTATVVMSVALIIRQNLDSFIIGRLVNIEAVAVYGIAWQLIHYAYSIVNAGMGVVTPRFANLVGRNSTELLKTMLLKSTTISSALAFGFGCLSLTLGGRFILFWVGSGFSGAIPVFMLLTGAYVASMAQNPIFGYLLAVNRHQTIAIVTLCEAGVNLLLSILLAPRYGIVGVALGTAIPMLAVKLIIQPLYFAKIAGVAVSRYLRSMLGPFLSFGVCLLVAYWGFGTDFFLNLGEKSMFLFVVLVGIVYAILTIVLMPLSGFQGKDLSLFKSGQKAV